MLYNAVSLTYRVKYRQKELGYLRNIRGCKAYFLFIVLLLQGGGV